VVDPPSPPTLPPVAASPDDAQRGPASGIIDADPRDTLARLLDVEEARQRARREDLATIRNALARLHDLDIPRDVPAIAPITAELAPTLLRILNEETSGPVRSAVLTAAVGSGVAPDLIANTQAAIRAGLEQRAVYDETVLQNAQGRSWVAEWAEVGERQRVLAGVPSEFAVYGERAVVAPGVWGDPEADYVVVRDPMLVQVFCSLFDRMWDHAAPVTTGRVGDEAEDEYLLSLLSRGLKDEAIARYLGWSLRTVRRRVARLMVDLGARTRFQLGAEAVRAGRLSVAERPLRPAPTRSAGGSRQLGPPERTG
jgi:DNA-binding CsgD family transcriptional regulator